jgi:hypothetical protein
MVQLVTSMDRRPVQQLIIAPIPTTIQVNISLPIYVPKGFIQQPPNGG